jgi:hypothetical protein
MKCYAGNRGRAGRATGYHAQYGQTSKQRSTVVPTAMEPVSMPPVRSTIVRVSVRSVIVTGRIVRRAVKHRHWQRNRESEENSSLGPRLEQHRYGENKRKDQKKSSHNIYEFTDERPDRVVTESRRAQGELLATPLQFADAPTKIRCEKDLTPSAPPNVRDQGILSAGVPARANFYARSISTASISP